MFNQLNNLKLGNYGAANALMARGFSNFTDAVNTYGSRVKANAENKALSELMGNPINARESGIDYRTRLMSLMGLNPDIDAKTGLEAVGLMSTPYTEQQNNVRDYDRGVVEFDTTAAETKRNNMMGDLQYYTAADGSQKVYDPYRSGMYDPNSIIQTESGGSITAKNPRSTAYGFAQVLDDTNASVSKRLGFTPEYGRTPEGQKLVWAELQREYKQQLGSMNLPVNNENMLSLHQLGLPDFIEFQKGKLSREKLAMLKTNAPIQYNRYVSRYSTDAPGVTQLSEGNAPITGDSIQTDKNGNAKLYKFTTGTEGGGSQDMYYRMTNDGRIVLPGPDGKNIVLTQEQTSAFNNGSNNNTPYPFTMVDATQNAPQGTNTTKATTTMPDTVTQPGVPIGFTPGQDTAAESKEVRDITNTMSPLSVVKDTYRDDYVGPFDSRAERAKAALNMSGTEDYQRFTGAIGDVSNEMRNSIFGAVVPDAEMEQWLKQIPDETSSDAEFVPKWNGFIDTGISKLVEARNRAIRDGRPGTAYDIGEQIKKMESYKINRNTQERSIFSEGGRTNMGTDLRDPAGLVKSAAGAVGNAVGGLSDMATFIPRMAMGQLLGEEVDDRETPTFDVSNKTGEMLGNIGMGTVGGGVVGKNAGSAVTGKASQEAGNVAKRSARANRGNSRGRVTEIDSPANAGATPTPGVKAAEIVAGKFSPKIAAAIKDTYNSIAQAVSPSAKLKVIKEKSAILARLTGQKQSDVMEELIIKTMSNYQNIGTAAGGSAGYLFSGQTPDNNTTGGQNR